MAQKDVGNKIPIYKLKTTDEVMKYYDDWGVKNKYDKEIILLVNIGGINCLILLFFEE